MCKKYNELTKMIDLIFRKIYNNDIEVDKKVLLSIMSDADSKDIDRKIKMGLRAVRTLKK